MLKRFFLNCNDGIPPDRVERLVDKYGRDILIGIDPGENDRPSEDPKNTIEKVKDLGAKLHVYLVGPGMMSWSEQEREQIQRFADSVGIDIEDKNWHNEWIFWGWKEKVLEQFEYYFTEHNAYSCEIDNLDSALDSSDPEQYISYYMELEKALKEKNITTKLMVKNLSEDILLTLQEAINKNDISIDFICEWGMFEKDSGDVDEQIRLCKEMGIYAVTPKTGITDTYHYGTVAKGVPSLNK